MYTVLITGGAGFIGINLIKKLLENPDNFIIVIDNGISSNRFFNDFLKVHEKRVEFWKKDICDRDLNEMIQNQFSRIDEIYHLASIASPIFYKKYPIETLDVSYIGSKNIFELALYYKCKILIASTSEVYGDPSISPQIETYFGNVNSFGPRSCYDEGKRVMEALAFTYQKHYQVDVKIARIFNTYGPYMNIFDGRIIPSLIESFIQHKPIQIYNGGKQTRSFNYIDDTLKGLMDLMKSDVMIPVNIGNDNEVSIIDTYLMIKKIIEERYPQYGTDLEIEYGFSDENDPKVRRPDLTRAKELLDYKIQTSFEEGICQTIDYFIEYFTKTEV